MFQTIAVPIDLAHKDALDKVQEVAGSLAKQWGATIVYVGVTGSAPGSVAHNPSEYQEKLAAFAGEEADRFGVTVEAKTVVSHDPAVDLNGTLMSAFGEVNADCVVMASRIPGWLEQFWPSHGAFIAGHAAVSVFLVR